MISTFLLFFVITQTEAANCNAPGLKIECEQRCMHKWKTCFTRCPKIDLRSRRRCQRKCAETLVVCRDDCPCNSKCPKGCPCARFNCCEKTENAARKCKTVALSAQGLCLYGCDIFDRSCFKSCYEQTINHIKACFCHLPCFQGCGCFKWCRKYKKRRTDMNERFVFDRTEANPVKSSTSPFIKTTVVTSLITFTSKKTTTMTTTTSSPILATSSASQSSYEHESLSNFNVTVDSFGDAILVVSSSSSFIYRWMENNEVGGESVVPIKLLSDGYNPYGSCSAIFKGRVLLFGGEGRLSRSIQLLNGCSIIPIVGELPAPMSFHSCAVSFESVYLCGAWNDRRACYLFNDHTTRLIESTNSGHALSAMVSYRMYPVIIAGQDVYDEYTNKVEVYGGYNWKYGADLPTNLRFHTAIAVHEKIYVFGGYFYGIKDFVIEYDGYRWKRRSSLVEPRYDHSSIRIGSRIFHVGSSRTNMPIESWDALSGEHKDSASYLYGVKRPFLLPVTFSDYGPCV